MQYLSTAFFFISDSSLALPSLSCRSSSCIDKVGRPESSESRVFDCSYKITHTRPDLGPFMRDFPAKRGWSALITGNRPVSNPVPCHISILAVYKNGGRRHGVSYHVIRDTHDVTDSRHEDLFTFISPATA